MNRCDVSPCRLLQSKCCSLVQVVAVIISRSDADSSIGL